ncbi:3330_t:CDS:1, partial [Paraglomus occultum]
MEIAAISSLVSHILSSFTQNGGKKIGKILAHYSILFLYIAAAALSTFRHSIAP